MLLHNHIVDSRNGQDTEDANFFRNFDIAMDRVQRSLTMHTGEIPRATVSDNNEPKSRGRRTSEETRATERGNAIRESHIVGWQQMR